ncbi:MAG TPA: hypothetical protein VGL66_06540 [Caulobacteraceae bacterium]|jgi:hypothetical protein
MSNSDFVFPPYQDPGASFEPVMTGYDQPDAAPANTQTAPPQPPTSAPVAAAAPPSPSWMQRVQGVVGLPTTPMSPQARLLTLANQRPQDATHPASPPQPVQLSPGGAQHASPAPQIGPLRFGVFGANAPRPGQTLYQRPGGPSGFMQPGGGAGPIPAPGSGGGFGAS